MLLRKQLLDLPPSLRPSPERVEEVPVRREDGGEAVGVVLVPGGDELVGPGLQGGFVGGVVPCAAAPRSL